MMKVDVRKTVIVLIVLLCTTNLAAVADEERPGFHIDHVGCVIDKESFDALSSSEFLKEFFAHSRPGGATTGSGTSWTNFSIFGELTFVEFLESNAARDLGVKYGECFVALHSATEGGAQWLADRMRAAYPESNPHLQLREFARGEESVPWSYNLTFDYDSGFGKFDIWIKEYHPEFKSRMTSGRAVVGDIDRRRGAPPVAFHPEKLFGNVTGLHISVPRERQQQIEQVLEMIGFEHKIENGVSTWNGSDARIEISTTEAAPSFALSRIDLEMTRPLDSHKTVKFGPLIELQIGENNRGQLVFRTLTPPGTI